MTKEGSSSQRGRLKIGADDSTVDIGPPGQRLRQVQLERDPALGLLSLEDRFLDHGEIARGGMGAIHEVVERTLNRTVAMKVLQPERAHDRKTRNRFLAEAQVTGQLQHPNIVPVYELGADDDGKLFFTMRLIEGQTFSQFLKENPPDTDQGVEQALEVFFRVCDALAFAHARGVVHRDIKPSNIMVADFGQVYLMDWGIARLLTGAPGERASSTGLKATTTLTIPAIDERGLVMGTYHYMAPEQALGAIDEIDERTDVFMLGAVLFKIATGRPPIDGDTAADALSNASKARVVDMRDEVQGALPRALLEVALQAMQADRARRFQNVASLKRATREVLRGRFRFPVQKVNAGTAILTEGEQGDDAFYIRSGHCRVYSMRDGVEVELQVLGPGEVFGETAVFTGQPRNASVAAVDAVELVVVPGKFLAGTLGLDSWMGAFVKTLGERFTQGSKRMTELEVGRRRAEVLATAYQHLALKGVRGSDGTVRLDWAELSPALDELGDLDEATLRAVLTEGGLAVEGRGNARTLVLAP